MAEVGGGQRADICSVSEQTNAPKTCMVPGGSNCQKKGKSRAAEQPLDSGAVEDAWLAPGRAPPHRGTSSPCVEGVFLETAAAQCTCGQWRGRLRCDGRCAVGGGRLGCGNMRQEPTWSERAGCMRPIRRLCSCGPEYCDRGITRCGIGRGGEGPCVQS
ncbi:hypothetical protein P154DRAFT_212376 [Amniculicola lignicola CBS 123094]|uniref:Uncharacterized protein n=1 Tax=Amniculicola lignicola CBS 123094 TaxID=1392246 RepID=A0A6A5WLL0_9PLEO|nr:hypothetical protein P154DRAFT_212376 [Amniculicola lignicola CBS 123094]